MSTSRPARLYVISVGMHGDKVVEAVKLLGLTSGDHVLAVNSIPKAAKALEAMDELRRFAEENGAGYTGLWLDLRRGFMQNVAIVRSYVEEIAPRREALFMVSGGFRWLALSIHYAAAALATVQGLFRTLEENELKLCSSYQPPKVLKVYVDLEEVEETRNLIKKYFPTKRDRLIEISHVVPLADLGYTLASPRGKGQGPRFLKPRRLYVTTLALVREYLQPGILLPRRKTDNNEETKPKPLRRITDLARAVQAIIDEKRGAEAARPYTPQCLKALWGGATSDASIAETVRHLVYLAKELNLLTLKPIKPTETSIALVARHEHILAEKT